MSHINDFGRLQPRPGPMGASASTQRHVGFALIAAWLAGCATGPTPGMGDSIDFIDRQGREGTLASARGKVVIIDVCASWATACNLNARVLDEVQVALAGEPVEIVSLLVDDGAMGREALRSYTETLGVQHRVLLAGSRVRAGTSVLGEAGYVPRLVVLDKDGAVRIDDSGGIVSVEGLVGRVRPLLTR